MPPRKKRLQPSRLILSSSSSSSAPLYEEETTERRITLGIESSQESTDLFQLPEEISPMKSPSKLSKDLLQDNTISASILKLPLLSPPKTAELPRSAKSKKRNLFFHESRHYDFIRDKNERSLLIFEMIQFLKTSKDQIDTDKLIASLYQVTTPENIQQLLWIKSNVEIISCFANYDQFFQWLKNEVPYRGKSILDTYPQLTPIVKIIQVLILKLIDMVQGFFITLLFIIILCHILNKYDYFSVEVNTYFELIQILLYMIFDSLGKS